MSAGQAGAPLDEITAPAQLEQARGTGIHPGGDSEELTQDLRVAVEHAVAVHGLRPAARAVGMSPQGLRNFVDGRKPQPDTLRKLQAWWLMGAGLEEVEVPRMAVTAALALLTAHLSGGARERLIERLVATVREETWSAAVKAPRWLGRS